MIIGLSGRKRSGKSTLGAALEKEFGFKQLAFADGVREFIAAAFEWPMEIVMSDDFKQKVVLTRVSVPLFSKFDHDPTKTTVATFTGRELLQRIGTDAARKIFGEDCWVNVGMNKALDATNIAVKAKDVCAICKEEAQFHHWPRGGCLGQGWDNSKLFISSKHYVFTDVRFPNEVKAIQNAGGRVIRLNTVESVETLHEYVQAPSAELEDGFCNFVMGSIPELREGGGVDCGLPRAAHPCPFPIDRHVSECSLPDVGDYNLTLTGSLDVNTTAAVNAVKGWLAK